MNPTLDSLLGDMCEVWLPSLLELRNCPSYFFLAPQSLEFIVGTLRSMDLSDSKLQMQTERKTRDCFHIFSRAA